MPTREELELQHDRTVREEIEIFRDRPKKYWQAKSRDDEFRPFRLKHGIYGQRQPGVQMVRTKVPGGLLTARQMEQLACIADQFGGGRGHLTTRQNIQYHFVPLARVPDLMHLLADAGLTNREACYNTVRNVTACSLGGAGPRRSLRRAALRAEGRVRLPAQGTHAEPAAQIQDRLRRLRRPGLHAGRDQRRRLARGDSRRQARLPHGGRRRPGTAARRSATARRVRARGAPGQQDARRSSASSIKYGNRKNKNKARLKFVMRERGFDWLREQIEKEYADILANGGIESPEMVPEGFGGYQSNPRRSAMARCCRWSTRRVAGNAEVRRAGSKPMSGAEADRLRGCDRARGPGQPDGRAVARRGADRGRRGRRPGAHRHRTESAAGLHSAGAAAGSACGARGASGSARRARSRSTTS